MVGETVHVGREVFFKSLHAVFHHKALAENTAQYLHHTPSAAKIDRPLKATRNTNCLWNRIVAGYLTSDTNLSPKPHQNCLAEGCTIHLPKQEILKAQVFKRTRRVETLVSGLPLWLLFLWQNCTLPGLLGPF